MLKIKQMWISVNRFNGPVNGPLTVSVNDSVNGPVAKQEKRPTIFDESFSADMNKKLRKEVSAVCVKLYETLSASTYKEPLSWPIFVLTSFPISILSFTYILFSQTKSTGFFAPVLPCFHERYFIIGFFKSPIWSFVMLVSTCLFKLVKQRPLSKFMFVCF